MIEAVPDRAHQPFPATNVWRSITADLLKVVVAVICIALLGAILGFGVAWIVVAKPVQPNKDDWSPLLYILFPFWGGGAGGILGLVIGLVWAGMPSRRRPHGNPGSVNKLPGDQLSKPPKIA